MERVSIRDALGGLAGLKRGGFGSLWKKVELIEPTFQVLAGICAAAQGCKQGSGIYI